MTQSVMQDRKSGPDWPLGLIVVTVPGTPVGFMSLVDPNAYNAPETATVPQSDEYGGGLCQQIIVQGFNSNAGTGLQPNTGNVYIMRKGAQGLGNRTDFGAMVYVVLPGQSIVVSSAAPNLNSFSPYRYYLDADNANDGALITLLVQ